MTNDKIGRRRPISRPDFNVKLKKGEKKRVIDATIKLFFPPRVEIMSLVNLVYQFPTTNVVISSKIFSADERTIKLANRGNWILARSCSCDEQATDKYTARIPSRDEKKKRGRRGKGRRANWRRSSPDVHDILRDKYVRKSKIFLPFSANNRARSTRFRSRLALKKKKEELCSLENSRSFFFRFSTRSSNKRMNAKLQNKKEIGRAFSPGPRDSNVR